jgi:hypothetical protein
MPADSCERIATPEGECLDPQSGRAVTVVGSRAEGCFLLGRPGREGGKYQLPATRRGL